MPPHGPAPHGCRGSGKFGVTQHSIAQQKRAEEFARGPGWHKRPYSQRRPARARQASLTLAAAGVAGECSECRHQPAVAA